MTTVATKAPAMTGAQLTADQDNSTGASTKIEPVGIAISRLLAEEQEEEDDKRDRHADQPKQNTTTHGEFLQCFKSLSYVADGATVSVD